MRIAVIVVSDRASQGLYEDRGGPAIAEWLERVVVTPYTLTTTIIPDGVDTVSTALIAACDVEQVDLVLTTGGTGPAARDLTVEATRAVIDKEMPGFGEVMRQASLRDVPTAILSRQTAGIRNRSLIINLPGKPAAIGTCLNAVFPAVPYCLDLIDGGFIDTDPSILASFRPKSLTGAAR
jgi:molybdopterin adenylyltransferase